MIQLLAKGDARRTMLHMEVANEVIRAINALLNMSITPEGAGSFTATDANSRLTLGNQIVSCEFSIGNGDLVTYQFVTFASGSAPDSGVAPVSIS